MRYDVDQDMEDAVGFVVGFLQLMEDPGRVDDFFVLELENPKEAWKTKRSIVGAWGNIGSALITTVHRICTLL